MPKRSGKAARREASPARDEQKRDREEIAWASVLPDDVQRRLGALAACEGVSRTELLEKALQAFERERGYDVASGSCADEECDPHVAEPCVWTSLPSSVLAQVFSRLLKDDADNARLACVPWAAQVLEARSADFTLQITRHKKEAAQSKEARRLREEQAKLADNTFVRLAARSPHWQRLAVRCECRKLRGGHQRIRGECWCDMRLGHTPGDVAHAFDLLPNLTYLDITTCNTYVLKQLMQAIHKQPEAFTKLKSLRLPCHRLGECWADEEVLAELGFPKAQRENSRPHLVYMLAPLQKLPRTSMHLDCSNSFALGECSEMGILQKLTNIEGLNLKSSQSVSDGFIMAMAPLTRLRYLNLKGCDRLTDDVLQPIAENFQALETLVLDWEGWDWSGGECAADNDRRSRSQSNLTLYGLEHLSPLSHSLRVLKLGRMEAFGDAELKALSVLVSLRHLSASSRSRRQGVTSQGLKAVSVLTNLRYLTILRCRELSFEGVLQALSPLRDAKLLGAHLTAMTLDITDQECFQLQTDLLLQYGRGRKDRFQKWGLRLGPALGKNKGKKNYDSAEDVTYQKNVPYRFLTSASASSGNHTDEELASSGCPSTGHSDAGDEDEDDSDDADSDDDDDDSDDDFGDGDIDDIGHVYGDHDDEGWDDSSGSSC